MLAHPEARPRRGKQRVGKRKRPGVPAGATRETKPCVAPHGTQILYNPPTLRSSLRDFATGWASM